LGEAVGVGVVGGALAALVGWIVGIEIAAAVVGTANGLISGWLGVYNLRRARGWAALTLDSTWGLLGVALGLVLHVANLFWPAPGYDPGLSVRQDRHLYAAGASVRTGFAFTLGNVVSNAGGRAGLHGDSPAVARRRRFVIAHEELHIWQNRWFGPLFQLVYFVWLVGGAIVGTIAWPIVRGRWWNAVETAAYYDNPFEYWAYRNDDYWPPSGAHPRLAWRRTVV
jgi:hypothetical protein